MGFGKIQNNILVRFRNPLRTDTTDIFTNDPELLLQYGWKEIVFTEPEEREGFRPVPYWEETETQIIQAWDYEPVQEDATEQDYIDALGELGVNTDEEG